MLKIVKIVNKLIKNNDLHKGFEILRFSDYSCWRHKEYRNNWKAAYIQNLTQKGVL